MKFIFAILSLVLIVLAVGTYLSYPDLHSSVPVIYWVTDSNPQRVSQAAGFQEWQIKNHLGEKLEITTLKQLNEFRGRNWSQDQRDAMARFNERGDKLFDPNTTRDDLPVVAWLPACELRLDIANNEPSKKIIQGVSGVGSEVFDCSGAGQLRYFQACGLTTNLDPIAKKMGFDLSQTWPAIAPDLTVDGHQYAFPCNVSVGMLMVNKAVFKKAGLSPPPRRWTFDEFETIGKQLVQKLNTPDQRERIFFCMNIDTGLLGPSSGLSTFDETMTHCDLDDPRYVECLRRIYKWTYEDRLLPSLADQASFTTQSGFGSVAPQLFNSGRLAMFRTGRWMLITFRQFNEARHKAGQPFLDLGVSEPPNGGLPYTSLYTRCAAVYVKYKDMRAAHLFEAYLASDIYNTEIVRDADALPPNPKYTAMPEFANPPDHPEEAGVSQPFADAAANIAYAGVYCPYVLDSIANRILKESQEGYMADRMTAEQAARQAADRINQEIQRTLRENPELQQHYDELCKRQKQIDKLLSEGKPVPASWIENPFYRRHYAEKGWLTDE